MATREYDFIVGPETDTLPTVGTPSLSADIMTLGFADTRYSKAPYVKTFNATSDWTGPSGGYYSMTVLASAHGKGTTPTSEVYIVNGSDFDETTAEAKKVNATGDIVLKVPDDLRFAGRLIVH